MKWVKKIISKFAKWFQPKHKIIHLDELPEKVNDKTIYIIGDLNLPWLLALKCPCGCGSLIQLNLLKDTAPCWSYKITKKRKINIFPSVWRTVGCKSHFVIRNSKIDWANYPIKRKFN